VHRLNLPEGIVEYARFGSGPTLLVLHGAGGGWDQSTGWARLRLADDRDVVAVSRFGYLGSTLPTGATTAMQADVYAQLLDALQVNRADVATLSAGSMTGLRFAGQHPDRVRRLVLESPMLPVRKPVRLPPAGVYRILGAAEPMLWLLTKSAFISRLAAGVPIRDLDEAGRAELTEINASAFPIAPRLPGMVFDRAVATPELYRGDIPVDRITAPTLIVNAADATLTPHDDAEAFARALPDGRLLDVASGGHVLVGNVERLQSVLSDFLGRSAADSSSSAAVDQP
jgi:pimeloyl-ACP methyl ester carboxylesterase